MVGMRGRLNALPSGELPFAEWVRIGINFLDELDQAAKRDEIPARVRHRLGDAVIALHDVRRMVSS